MTKTALGESDGDHSAGDVVGALVDLTRERRDQLAALERRESELVRRARGLGCSWQQIAGALDVSKQAVHKKYGRR